MKLRRTGAFVTAVDASGVADAVEPDPPLPDAPPVSNSRRLSRRHWWNRRHSTAALLLDVDCDAAAPPEFAVPAFAALPVALVVVLPAVRWLSLLDGRLWEPPEPGWLLRLCPPAPTSGARGAPAAARRRVAAAARRTRRVPPTMPIKASTLHLTVVLFCAFERAALHHHDVHVAAIDGHRFEVHQRSLPQLGGSFPATRPNGSRTRRSRRPLRPAMPRCACAAGGAGTTIRGERESGESVVSNDIAITNEMCGGEPAVGS